MNEINNIIYVENIRIEKQFFVKMFTHIIFSLQNIRGEKNLVTNCKSK